VCIQRQVFILTTEQQKASLTDKIQVITTNRGQTVQADEKKTFTSKSRSTFVYLDQNSQYNTATCTSIKILTSPIWWIT